MDPWIGQTLSKVKIERHIGRGGMADVYLGQHTTLDRPLAVKILKAHLTENEVQQSRFRAEAKTVAGMRHPHIVQVLDYDITGGRPYMIMEQIDGISLKEYLEALRDEDLQLTQASALRLIEQVAQALAYAHERGIIHRDVKPANIMLRAESGDLTITPDLGEDVTPILTDFGIARIADADHQTESGMMVGTPAYMSPEQVNGEGIDHRADIYALGIIAYELLAGKPPFEGETQASVMIAHITKPAPVLPVGSDEMKGVLARALAKDPAERYRTPVAFADALRQAADGSPPANDAPYETVSMPGPPADTEEWAAPPPQPESTSIPPIGIIAGIAGLLVVGVLILLAVRGGDQTAAVPLTATAADVPSTATPTSEAPTATVADAPSTGFVAAGAAIQHDTLTLTVEGEPPAGAVYEVWLIEPDESLTNIGVVEDGALTYTDPTNNSLLATYRQIVVAIGPAETPDDIIAQATVDDDTLDLLRRLNELSDELPPTLALLEGNAPLQLGLVEDTSRYDSHRGFTVEGLQAGDLEAAKLHAEHTLNILNGEPLTDWDGNGRPENPGDPFGLANYIRLLAALTPPESQELAALIDEAQSVITQAEALAGQIVAADRIEELSNADATLEGLALDSLAREIEQAAADDDLTVQLTLEP